MTGQEHRREIGPPDCCEDPEDSDLRRRIEYHAHALEEAAANDAQAVAHARAQREESLLAADVALGKLRAAELECGIECLDEDIERARELARRI